MFDFVENCDTYEDPIDTLKNMYVKALKTIFARHILATAQQEPRQSLREFLQNLQSLSKERNFRAVTGEKYRQDMVRDSFINGLTSVAVRNRYTSRFTAASIWEILSLIVLLTRDPRRTSTHQLAEHEDCIKEEQKILLTKLLHHTHQLQSARRIWL